MKQAVFLFLLLLNSFILYAQELVIPKTNFSFSDTSFSVGQVKIIYRIWNEDLGFRVNPSPLSAYDSIVIFLKKHPQFNIEIGSYTDSKGSAKINLTLSKKRAHAFFDSLVVRGIDSMRLSYKGYGQTEYLVSNKNNDGTDCPECRQKNRRIELKITQTIDASKRKYFQFNDNTFEVGEVKIPVNILFCFDSCGAFPPSSFVSLDSIVEFLKYNPNIYIEISNHTDVLGNMKYNLKLSQARAQMIYDYLVQKGIDKNRLSAKGYGSALPLVPNTYPNGKDNPEGRQKNRRTELKIIKS